MVESKTDKRIRQLDHILKDDKYFMSDGYRIFVNDMHKALRGDRKITEKMNTAINSLIKNYTKYFSKANDPKYKKKKTDYTLEAVGKLNEIRRTLAKCNYTSNYTLEKKHFIESIERQVYTRGSLTINQRKALNGMYNQFKKRVESL